MTKEKPPAATEGEEVKPGMNSKIVTQLLPPDITDDDVLFGLRLGNALWHLVNAKPIPPLGAK